MQYLFGNSYRKNYLGTITNGISVWLKNNIDGKQMQPSRIVTAGVKCH